MKDIAFFLYGGICGVGAHMLAITAWDLGKEAWRRRADRSALHEYLPSTTAAKTNKRWHSMPCGRRLELGASGYWIELIGKPGQATYRCYDPEGDRIGSGQNLVAIKKYLEEQADARDEFAPRPAARLQNKKGTQP